MQNIKTFFKNLWADESAQGTAEYVLLLVVVIAVVILFRDRIKAAIGNQMTKVEGGMDTFSTNQ